MKKMKVLLFILKIFSYSLSDVCSNKYSAEVNTSIDSTVSLSWLIQSYKLKSKFECLAQCNFKSDCYTATYSSDSGSLDNCILFSKYFNQSELVSLEDTNLYSKDFACKLN
jgi:hypothetical protein